jgi:hypothetical protein
MKAEGVENPWKPLWFFFANLKGGKPYERESFEFGDSFVFD